MDAKQTVTIVDVARRARVSAGTVSNVLTGKRPVAEATRVRILRAIEELGYQPNLLARSLVNRASHSLGVVTSGLEFYGPVRTLVGIEQAANELGYTLLLDLLHNPEEDAVDAVLDDLLARRVDGIIWAVHEVGNNRAWMSPERLNAMPPVVFLTMETRPHASILSTDNRAGAVLAVRHLLEQGRRTVGIVTGPLNWWEARERLAGWRATLAAAGCAAHDDLVFAGDWSSASGEQALYHLLAARPDLDAVFACNDLMALGVLRACALAGRRIPDDVAVVGFDNMPEAAYFLPALTSVRQHLADLGRVAVQELHGAIEARSEGELRPATTHLIAPELVVRESSQASNPHQI